MKDFILTLRDVISFISCIKNKWRARRKDMSRKGQRNWSKEHLMWQALFSLFMLETLIKQLKIGKLKGKVSV